MKLLLVIAILSLQSLAFAEKGSEEEKSVELTKENSNQSDINKLEWGSKYPGTVKELQEKEKSVELTKENSNQSDINKLEWGSKYPGTVKELQETRKRVAELFDTDGNVFGKYKGQIGMKEFALDFFDGDLDKAFLEVDSVATNKEKTQLDWIRFRGDANEFELIRDVLKVGGREIFYLNYFGEKEGLEKVVTDLMRKFNVESRPDSERIEKIKDLIKASVTSEERKFLGWKLSKSPAIPKLRWSRIFKRSKGEIVDPKKSVHKAGKK